MMGASRRQFLSFLAQALLLPSVGRAAPAGALDVPAKVGAAAGSTGPRYLLQVVLGGGIDPIYTTDPRSRAEVEPWVEVPYASSAIVDAAGIPFGPHFVPLAPWAPKLTVLNGVECGTVAHETGRTRVSRFRLNANTESPTLLEIVGQASNEHPLAGVQLGAASTDLYSADWFASTDRLVPGSGARFMPTPSMFEFLDALGADDLEMLAKTFHEHAERIRRSTTAPAAQKTATNYERVARLFRRLTVVPKFTLATWSPVADRQTIARSFQRALWVIENDLSPTVLVQLGLLDWDTHYKNAERQQLWNGHFAAMANRFFTELSTRKNAHGVLLERTNLVISSEVGRHPRLNPNDGKDHFPEIAMMFMGPSFGLERARGRVFGETGRDRAGLPISSRTGRRDGSGARATIDDVGTTLLAMHGVDPSTHGYAGRPLAFLQRES
jgi:hypothetical protein